MIIPNSISPLVPADHKQVLQLFRRTRRQHMQLDWLTLEDWLERPELHCWIASNNSSLEALLGASIEKANQVNPDEPLAAWLRFAIPPMWGLQNMLLNRLWKGLREELVSLQVQLIGMLDLDGWMGRYVQGWGFKQTNSVVTLRRDKGELPPPLPIEVTIRQWTSSDLPAIVDVDTAAFGPLWRYTLEDINPAARQAAIFTVAVLDGKIIAYQLSTRYAGSGHLARLAVRPEFQGYKIGSALVHQMIQFFRDRGIHIITVNTQADNLQSQNVYKRFGFYLTGHRVPVWTLDL